jgi:hypothetical protein
MRGAGAAGAWQSGDWGGCLGQASRRGKESAVAVESGNVDAGGGLCLRQEKARGEEGCGGLRAESASCGCHGG